MDYPFYFTWSKQKDTKSFQIDHVDGVYLYSDNLKIIDMSSISYQAHFGHNHPEIIKEIKSQIDTVPMSSPKAIFPNKIETTKRLLNYMNLNEGKIFYTTSGAESVENALKMARDITKRKIVLARSNSYHGATLGALTVTGDWRNPPHITPKDWVARIPEPFEPNALYKTREIIKNLGKENIAAIILETITGGNGVITGNQEWWDGMRSICDENNIMLILDEVVCGFARTGKPFAYMHFNINADLICLAKGISGGMIPFGAVWTSKKITQYYEDNILCCGLTNYAHPLGIAALKGVLNIVENQNFNTHLRHVESFFAKMVQSLKSFSFVKEVRFYGMLCAVDLTKSIDASKFLKNGVYLVSQPNRIILAPPLIITETELEAAFNSIKKTFSEEL